MKFKIISIFAVPASLAACSTVADKAPAALPIIDSAKFETVDKAKTDLKTPTGTKQIYDPLQDPDVRLAFEGFTQAKQQSGYFKGWPRNLQTHRSLTNIIRLWGAQELHSIMII